MIRGSNSFIIMKKDIKDGKVKKKRFNDITEYWIYKGQETNLLDIDGHKMIDETNVTLNAIITCNVDGHVLREGDKGFLVDGIKFTEKDIDDYLHKTKRSKI